MPRTVMMPVEVKRPPDATPERALDLLTKGVTVGEMAAMWKVSRSLVYYLLHKAGWEAPPKTA